jgi:hypothetical protein
MHVHLPKPLHGWREFLGEVGIIVIGVLIALGAEQLLEAARWRGDVAEARHSLTAQLALSKFAAIERLQASTCVDRKLDRLHQLLTAPGGRSAVAVDLAPIRLWSTSAWQSATASGAVAHMGSEERDRYANLFSFTDALGEQNRKEFDLSGEAQLAADPKAWSQGVRDELFENIARLKQYNLILTLGSQQWLAIAAPLHLQMDDEHIARLHDPGPCLMPDDPAARNE